jgi:glutathione peroxidase-family protein
VYNEYSSKGCEVLAFPCNQFYQQEPGTPAEIRAYAAKFNATFPMFEKVDVNGGNAHALFRWMKTMAGGGFMMGPAIKWNYTKFLIGKDGRVVRRYGPMHFPKAIVKDIQFELAKPTPVSVRPSS